MTILRIDVETYSSVDIKTQGAYRYVDSDDFEIILFGFAFDDDPVQVVDILGGYEDLPKDVRRALQTDVQKVAFNAAFERVTIANHFGIPQDPRYWQCTAAQALTLGLPGHLDGVAKALGLDEQKDTRGKALIKYFSTPCKATKVNGGRTRNYPHHNMEKWLQYIEYCRQDVEVEREVSRALSRWPMPEREQRIWQLDQQINDRGVRLDPRVYETAIAVNEANMEIVKAQAAELTGLANPKSGTQFRAWLAEQGLETPDGLGKDFIEGLIADAPTEEVKQALLLWREMNKTSVDKYKAMARSVCKDGRARGLLQYCGANRTWRWAGRLIQIQNLPQNKVNDLLRARETLIDGEPDWIESLYGSIPFILSQLIRTAFIPDEGSRFIVDDFSAIEARVIAWLAGEEWVLDVFKSHGKIYEATASQMFGIPFETIVKGHDNYSYRAFGKVGTLACGFQGGPKAIEAMDSKKEINPDDYPMLVEKWREANPNIVALWKECDKAAVRAIRTKSAVKVQGGKVVYYYEGGNLFAKLPSGRSLCYWNARLERDPKFDSDKVVFDGMDQVKKTWGKQQTYGGKLVENLVQAIARDCLAETLDRLDRMNYKVVMHVHDEVVIEAPYGFGSVEHVTHIMSEPIPWAPDLPLSAAGFECTFYQKD